MLVLSDAKGPPGVGARLANQTVLGLTRFAMRSGVLHNGFVQYGLWD